MPTATGTSNPPRHRRHIPTRTIVPRIVPTARKRPHTLRIMITPTACITEAILAPRVASIRSNPARHERLTLLMRVLRRHRSIHFAGRAGEGVWVRVRVGGPIHGLIRGVAVVAALFLVGHFLGEAGCAAGAAAPDAAPGDGGKEEREAGGGAGDGGDFGRVREVRPGCFGGLGEGGGGGG